MANYAFIPINGDPFIVDVDNDQDEVRIEGGRAIDDEDMLFVSINAPTRVFLRARLQHADGAISAVYLER